LESTFPTIPAARRLFSHVDTQLNRHGGPNFELLPIVSLLLFALATWILQGLTDDYIQNCSRNGVHNNNRGGAGRNRIHLNKYPKSWLSQTRNLNRWRGPRLGARVGDHQHKPRSHDLPCSSTTGRSCGSSSSPYRQRNSSCLSTQGSSSSPRCRPMWSARPPSLSSTAYRTTHEARVYLARARRARAKHSVLPRQRDERSLDVRYAPANHQDPHRGEPRQLVFAILTLPAPPLQVPHRKAQRKKKKMASSGIAMVVRCARGARDDFGYGRYIELL
jgi:hypothetical protein